MTNFHFGIGERWALVAAVAYTVVNVTLRIAAPTIDPALGSLLRLVPLGLIAWFVVLRGGAREFRPGRPEFLGWRLIGALLVGGATSLVLGNILYLMALTNGGLGITVSGVQGGSVLGGLWIGLLVLAERPRRAQIAGAAVIVIGLVSIAIAQTRSVLEFWWVGLIFALGAGTTYAISNVLSGFVQRRRPLLFVTLAGSNIGGLVPLLLIVGSRWAANPASVPVDARSAIAVLIAGLANAVALAALTMAVRHTTVAATTMISSSSIVLSFAASVLLFSETGAPAMLLGVLLVTAGIVVAQVRRGARPRAIAEPGPYAPGD
jgi:drug/metabolite transporter (DMT)-like permease